MRGRIPDEVLESIRERISIVEVISGHVALKRAGRNFVGLCPFHTEKTPSFTVSEDRGLYHCFGCGESGSVFSFLMKVDGVDFLGAVEQLASAAGVRLPDDGATRSQEDRTRLFQLGEAAQRRYREALRGAPGRAAREYLAARGLNEDILERYGIGFCPSEGSEFLNAIGGRAKAIEAAVKLGIVGRRDDGRLFDRQWGRVTFPIRDGSGRIVGFGGRAMDDRQPKYLNSPDSPLFHKGRILYGLFEARAAIRAAQRVVIVEGYMDVLALAQAGIHNAVANLGTALTEDQLRLAKRFGAMETVAFFDGDRAGRAAALRAFEICCAAGLLAYGAFLPEEDDPDSFVRSRGVDATRDLLASPISLADFFLDTIDPGAAASLLERQAAAKRAGGVLSRTVDPVQFGLLARLAAERLRVDESVFRELRRGAKSPAMPPSEGQRRSAQTEDAPPDPGLGAEEATLLEAMALGRDACDAFAAHPDGVRLLSAKATQLAHQISAAWEQGHAAEAIVDLLPPASVQRVAAAAFGQGPLAGVDRVKLVRDFFAYVERRSISARLRDARERLRHAEQAGDEAGIRARLHETRRLTRRPEVDG